MIDEIGRQSQIHHNSEIEDYPCKLSGLHVHPCLLEVKLKILLPVQSSLPSLLKLLRLLLEKIYPWRVFENVKLVVRISFFLSSKHCAEFLEKIPRLAQNS